MIKVIVFDWGDVCGLYNLEVFSTFLKKLSYDSSISSKYFEEFKPKFDRAILSEEEFWSGLSKKLEFDYHWSILATNNKKNLIVNWPLLDIIKKLRSNFKIALLSNMDPTSISGIRSEVKLSEYFDKVYFSSEIKKGKLEKEAVDMVLKDFNATTQELLFIDDYSGNIEKAKSLGMKTLLFKDIQEFKKELNSLLEN